MEGDLATLLVGAGFYGLCVLSIRNQHETLLQPSRAAVWAIHLI